MVWPKSDEIAHIETMRNEFLAHAGESVMRLAPRLENVQLSEIDAVQQAFARTERVLTDIVLTRRHRREVVPMPPLGLFAGLNRRLPRPEPRSDIYRS